MEDLHIYIRVSTEVQQTDGFGLENQKEVGLRVCEKLGMNPIIHNEGSKSSSSENIDERPKLNDLMFKINNGGVKHLWVFNNDRLSRNENVWNTIRLTLRKNECKLYVGEGTEYQLENMMDDFIFGIMSEVTKYDNRLRTERLQRGKLSKVKRGGWKGGPPPFGYEIANGELKPNTYEKRWVRKIYEEYSNGSSIYEINKHLMKNGVKSRRGNIVWSDQSIRKILENTHFEGYYFYTDKKLKETVKVDCPKLLPMSLIRKVRNKLSKSTYKSNYVKYETLLREFLVCGHCGSKFGQRISKTQYKNHYFCRGNTERLRSKDGTSEIICKTDDGRVRSLFITDTDDFVWTKIVDTLENSNLFKELFKKEVMSEQKSFGLSQSEIKKYERKIKKNQRTIKDIIEAMNSSLVEDILNNENKENFKSITKQFEKKKLELLSENEELTEIIYSMKRSTKWVEWVDEFKGKIEDLRHTEMDTLEKRKFLDGILEKIIVTTKDKQTHSLDIRFNSPYVGDELQWNVKGKPKNGYKLIDGTKDLVTFFESSNTKKNTIKMN